MGSCLTTRITRVTTVDDPSSSDHIPSFKPHTDDEFPRNVLSRGPSPGQDRTEDDHSDDDDEPVGPLGGPEAPSAAWRQPEPDTSVKTTTVLEKTYDPEGSKMVNDYTIVELLGQGSYGKVKLCIRKASGEAFAIKICNKSLLRKRRRGSAQLGHTALDEVRQEIALMKKLDHPNIVKLLEVIDDPSKNKLYMILEYVEGGPVMKGTMVNDPLPIDRIRSHLADIASGLAYLHLHNIVHRDIKPENLLVTSTGHLKISDFGVSEVLTPGVKLDVQARSVGTPAFMAPELVTSDLPLDGEKIDIWAVGVTAFIMAYGRCPFVGEGLFELHENIRLLEPAFPIVDGGTFDPLLVHSPKSSDSGDEIVDETTPGSLTVVHTPVKSDRRLDPLLLDLLHGLLNKDAAKRFTIEQLASHPFLVGGKERDIEKRSIVVVSESEVEGAIVSAMRAGLRMFLGDLAGVLGRRRVSVSSDTSEQTDFSGSGYEEEEILPPSGSSGCLDASPRPDGSSGRLEPEARRRPSFALGRSDSARWGLPQKKKGKEEV